MGFLAQLFGVTPAKVRLFLHTQLLRFCVCMHCLHTQIVNNTRAGEVYLLYQCGTPNPQASNTELDLPPNTKVFEVPLVSVAVTDSNAAAFLVRSFSD